MSKHGGRNQGRAVTPGFLQTPESGAAPLLTQDPEDMRTRVQGEGVDDKVEDELVEPAPHPPGTALASILRTALEMPPDRGHWAAMWLAGRDAAIDALKRRITARRVRSMEPPQEVGCRACWARGRDAVLKLLEE
jgi:hypothetical protein